MCYWAMSFQAMNCNVPDQWLYGSGSVCGNWVTRPCVSSVTWPWGHPTGPWTELPCPGSYCDKPLTTCYMSVHFVLLERGHVLLGCGPCVTGPWTIIYHAVDHVLCSCVHVLSGHGHILPGGRAYCTWPLTMCYRALYHVLVGHGHILTGRGTWVTRPWIIMYWAVDLMLQGYVACASKPLTYSTRTWPWFARFRMNGMANCEFRSTRKTNCSAMTGF